MMQFMKILEWCLAYSKCLMYNIFLLLLILGIRILTAIVTGSSQMRNLFIIMSGNILKLRITE